MMLLAAAVVYQLGIFVAGIDPATAVPIRTLTLTGAACVNEGDVHKNFDAVVSSPTRVDYQVGELVCTVEVPALTRLTPGAYRVAVRPVSGTRHGPWSAAVNVITVPATPAAPVADLPGPVYVRVR